MKSIPIFGIPSILAAAFRSSSLSDELNRVTREKQAEDDRAHEQYLHDLAALDTQVRRHGQAKATAKTPTLSSQIYGHRGDPKWTTAADLYAVRNGVA